jgi:hypothetical protein
VNYHGREDLVLIGVRDRFTGQDWFYPQIAELAHQYGFSLPETYQFDSTEHMIATARALDVYREGWVVRCADGQRFKVKGDAYRIAHRIRTQATFGQVLAAVAEATLMTMIDGVPDEFLDQIKAWQAEIEAKVEEVTQRIDILMPQVPTADRKAAALWIRENCPQDAQYVFAQLDGKPLEPLIYKNEFRNRSVE